MGLQPRARRCGLCKKARVLTEPERPACIASTPHVPLVNKRTRRRPRRTPIGGRPAAPEQGGGSGRRLLRCVGWSELSVCSGRRLPPPPHGVLAAPAVVAGATPGRYLRPAPPSHRRSGLGACVPGAAAARPLRPGDIQPRPGYRGAGGAAVRERPCPQSEDAAGAGARGPSPRDRNFGLDLGWGHWTAGAPLVIGKGGVRWGCGTKDERAEEGVAMPASPTPPASPTRRAWGRYTP